jgi:hypothetical protein
MLADLATRHRNTRSRASQQHNTTSHYRAKDITKKQIAKRERRVLLQITVKRDCTTDEKKGIAIDKSILGEDQIIAAPGSEPPPLTGNWHHDSRRTPNGGQLPQAIHERLGVHGLDLPKYEERRKVEEGRMEGREDIAAQGR